MSAADLELACDNQLRMSLEGIGECARCRLVLHKVRSNM
jgi:hypothetical protein